VLYRDTAVVDLDRRALTTGVSILVDGARIAAMRPSEDDGVGSNGTSADSDVRIVDMSGTTAIPGMVDAHSHLTLPGGAHWIDRGFDPTDRLLEVAEDNARLLRQAGVRWARDVGAPTRHDPDFGVDRALSLTVRDRWRGRQGYPYVRAAGTWVARRGSLPTGLAVEVDDGDGLLAAAMRQLDDGADLVKLYLDGPDRDTAPFTADEVAQVVTAAHDRGARVTAHSGLLPGARVGAEAAVDAIEHGFALDDDVARIMAAKGVALVSTLAVLESWRTFGATTTIDRFASEQGRSAVAARRERAQESVRLAAAAGVLLAAGTDFGGGSLRANQLAWEVEALVGAGLEPVDALAAVTVNGGRLLGAPDAGIVREGGPADLVFVHGDPTSDPAALWRVWHVTW
jgi:imidazolonepropionase-like amidohydrolase